MSTDASRLKVRSAVAGDRSRLHELVVTRVRRPAQVRRDAFSGWWALEAQSILRDARPPRDAVLLGLLDDRLVAACRWAWEGDGAHIDAVGVAPDHHGQGLGSLMIVHVIQEIRLSRAKALQKPAGPTRAAAPPLPSSIHITAVAHRDNVHGLQTLRRAGMEALDDEDTFPYIPFYRLE